MKTILPVLAMLNTNVKQLSLSNVISMGNHVDIKDEALMNLSSAISALTENAVDKMTAT